MLHWGIVTLLRSQHFQVLPSSTTLPHWTRRQARDQTQVQPKDVWLMGHCGKDTTFPKEVMIDLECSPPPHSHSQDRGGDLQAHLECLQHHLETFQSFCRHLPPLLQMGKFLAHLGDPQLASQQNDFSRLWNSAGPMLPGLLICHNCQRFSMTNSMQTMRLIIVGPGRGWKQSPNQLEANRIHREAICPKHGAAQLQYVQQVE